MNTTLRDSEPRATRGSIVRDAPLLYRSTGFSRVLDEARRAARGCGIILLQGESGTGKGRLARLIHQESGRSGALVTWSAPESQGSLGVSEIFGHRKGSFTGADADRDGLFLTASGGTLLADDIDKLDRPLQGVVLRFLDELSVRPVGAAKPTPVDVLFIASTNRNLAWLAERGEYLPDLANRLTVLVLTIPPLRERPEDIAPLVDHFVREFSRAHQVGVTGVTLNALRILENEPWPANVRGLASVIENAVFRSKGGEIDVEAVMRALGRTPTTGEADLRALAPELRKSEGAIRRALELSGGNGKRAAEILSLPLRTFRRYQKKFDIRKRY